MNTTKGAFTCGFGLQRANLATRMRLARAALGWSQTELAERVGVTQRAIYRLESASAGCRKSTVTAIYTVFDEVGIRFQQLPDGSLTVTVPNAVLHQQADTLAP